MTATAAPSSKSSITVGLPTSFNVFVGGLTVCLAVALGASFANGGVQLEVAYIGWYALALAASLMPVRPSEHLQVDLSLPILVAAAVVVGPVPAALMTLLVPDPSDLRGGAPPSILLFNQVQTSLCVGVAGVLASAATGVVGASTPLSVALVVFVAFMADLGLNLVFTGVGLRLARGVSAAEFVRDALFGMPWSALVGYVCVGMLALPLVALYAWGGVTGLLAFLPILIVARQALQRGSELGRASTELQARDRALRGSQAQMASERADERLSIASALHDEVLQSLHFLTLHAHVVKEDLRQGQLLQLEEDVPALVRVSQDASDLTRQIVGELRHSPLGSDGFRSTVDAMIKRLLLEFRGTIKVDVDDLDGASPEAQLLSYQVVREAIMNAVKHSYAEHVVVSCRVESGTVLVDVMDDGIGFVPNAVDEARHFGLSLLRERIRAWGGNLSLSAQPGGGCSLHAEVPAHTTGTSAPPST